MSTTTNTKASKQAVKSAPVENPLSFVGQWAQIGGNEAWKSDVTTLTAKYNELPEKTRQEFERVYTMLATASGSINRKLIGDVMANVYNAKHPTTSKPSAKRQDAPAPAIDYDKLAAAMARLNVK